MKTSTRWLALVALLLTGCPTTHGAVKVAAGPGGRPWIVTSDGGVFAYNGSSWDLAAPPGTADDLAVCGTFLTILTRPDAQGKRKVQYRDIGQLAWTDAPWPHSAGIKQIACDGTKPVALAAPPASKVYRYESLNRTWSEIHDSATEISVENGRLFFLFPVTLATGNGNIWSKSVNGGMATRWDLTLIAAHIAGDANGFPWVATKATSNPLWKWDQAYQKFTFGPTSGPVYAMDVDSNAKMYILSDPAVSGGGYTVWSHDLSSGGWTRYSLPSY